MGLKQVLASMLPSFVKKQIRIQKALKQLSTTQPLECKIDNLRYKHDVSLNEIFSSREIDERWLESEKEIKPFNIPDGTGEVNPGDRRAIYYLISAIKPVSVLEIGTHIGASTVNIASVLRNGSDQNANITTVDINDVNSQIEKPWLKYGTTHSPIEMIEKMGCGSFVNFITGTSLNFAANCQCSFDFIFLDGDHSATTVYKEIPVALNLLHQNGVILLHDYYSRHEALVV